jgi:hypothetical protein
MGPRGVGGRGDGGGGDGGGRGIRGWKRSTILSIKVVMFSTKKTPLFSFPDNVQYIMRKYY